MFVRKRRRDASDEDSDDGDDSDSEDARPLRARIVELAAKAEPPPSTPSPLAPVVELPTACLIQILQAACADGAIPTACRMACVSRAWRDAVRLAGAALWTHADCSRGWCRPSDAVVSRLCRAGTMSQLHTLNVAGNRSLSDAALHAVATHCPALTALDVSGCQAFSAAALLAVLQPPRRIQSLQLARTGLRPAGNFDASVRSLLAAAAPSLRSLSLAGCARVTSATLRSLLPCAELRELDLTGAGSARGVLLPLDALQQACPLLEVLRLSGLGLDAGFTAVVVGAPRGFPRLRVCELSSGQRMTSHGAEPSASSVDDALLARLLCESTQLRLLAASGTHVTAAGLAALPACALESLLLDQSDAATDETAVAAASQWAASLRVITLAGGGAAVTDHAAFALAACAQLRTADLSGAAVTADGVRALLRARPRLALDLAGCRSLDRPVRQAALAGGATLRRALGL